MNDEFLRVVEIEKKLDDPLNRRKLGQRIQMLRIGRDLQQQRLAAAMGWHRTRLCKVEKGLQRHISISDLVSVSDGLNVPVSALMEGEPDNVQ